MRKGLFLSLLMVFLTVSFGFTFIVFGDNRPDAPYEPQPAVFKQILHEVGLWRPVFAVNLGDVLAGYNKDKKEWQREYLEYLDLLNKVPVKIYTVPGNHDLVFYGREFWKKFMGDEFYSFDYKGFKFIFLSTDYPDMYQFGADEYQWLLYQLREARSKGLEPIVFMHRPVFSYLHPKKITGMGSVQMAQLLHRTFVEYGVKYVFQGHEHCYGKIVKDGVNYIITGGAGAPLYPEVTKGGFYHYLVINADPKSKKLDIYSILPGDLYTKIYNNGTGLVTIELKNRFARHVYDELKPSFYVDVLMPISKRYRIVNSTCKAVVASVKPAGNNRENIVTIKVTPDRLKWSKKTTEKIVVSSF